MRESLKNSKRLVIKVGTSTLMYGNGHINLRTIEKLAMVLSDLRNEGKEVILVSSGAIGVGCHKLQLSVRPTSIPDLQAVASVGQSELMHIYSKFFGEYGQVVGQVLLTRDVTDFPISRENVMNTLDSLLSRGIIPIVNENDTVAVEELEHVTKYGDNDLLSAIVAKLVQADLLIMLSDIDGFYGSNPATDPEAVMFSEINQITPEIEALAGGRGSKFGTGGMLTKLSAASYCMDSNQKMILTNGKNPTVIFNIMQGEQIGTLFASKRRNFHMTELIKKGSGAKEASQFLAQATTKHKNAALLNLSNDLLIHTATLLQENEKDILRAQQKGTPETMIDRLRLTEERIKEISEAVKQVVALKDPIGEVTNMWKNEAELTIGKTRVPLGVIGIIYESRPNVTVDASVLCFKTGNAVILRGGSDAIDSNKALMSVIQDSLEASGFLVLVSN